MAGPLYAGFPNDIVLDAGILLINGSSFAPSRGGTRFSSGAEFRHPEIDGLFSEVEQLHRITGWTPVISGSWYFTGDESMPVIEPGVTEDAINAGGIKTTWTPQDGGKLFTASQYLSNVVLRGIRTLANGDEEGFEIYGAKGMVRPGFALVNEHKNEWMINDLEIQLVLTLSNAIANPRECPYIYRTVDLPVAS